MLPNAAIARFSRYVSAPNERGCRLWVGGRVGNGYGKFWLNGKSELAHRVAFAIANWRRPDGLVRHWCDTPLCCEASHLQEGTALDNARDCIERGRRRPPHEYRPRRIQSGDNHYSRTQPQKVLRGERVGTSKLTAQQVAEIRAARARGEKLRALAARYGVSETMISYIARGKSWSERQIASGAA